MVKDEFMKYKAPTNSIPTYKLYDFEASLNYKPLEYYASLSTDEYNKLGTELKANIEFTKWAHKHEIYGVYRFCFMKKKLTWQDKLHNFFYGQVFMWIIVPVTSCICISFFVWWILELLGF